MLSQALNENVEGLYKPFLNIAWGVGD